MSALDLALLALLAPLAMGALLGLVAPLRKTGRPAGFLSVATAMLSCVASILVFLDQLKVGAGVLERAVWQWLPVHGQPLAGVGIHLDGISSSMLVVVTVVAACVQLFSLSYMEDEPPAAFGRYFTYHSLFIFSMAGLVLAPNLLQLFLCWELVGLVSYLLIGFYFKKPSAAKAAVKAFWVTKFADMGLVVGLIALYTQTGSFGWEPETVRMLGTAGATVVALGLFMAVMGKSAQFPLHIWLPDAMEGPTPVSALLHAATMVAAGVFLVVRAYPLFEASPTALQVMAYVGGVTAFFAACVAVVQTDIKKVLAYSTCSQLGYMIAALGSGSLMGGYFHLTTHAFFKALLFLGAGSLIHAVHSNNLSDMGGLFSKMKVTGTVFIIGALALSGFPGLSGFFSKDLILESLFEAQLYVPFGLAMGAAFLTAFYMTRVVFLALFGTPGHHAEHAHESPAPMTLPLMLLALLSVVAGFGGATFAHLYGVEYHFHLGAVGITATVLGLAGIGFGVLVYGTRTLPESKFWFLGALGALARSGLIDQLYAWAFHSVVLGIARLVGWFDRYIIDGAMNFLGWAFLVSGQKLRRLQTGQVADYLYAVVLGLMILSAAGWALP